MHVHRGTLAAFGLVGVTAVFGPLDADRTASAAAQTLPTPVFTAGTELVVLHVTVRNRRGEYVTDLPASAFTVLEDGEHQSVEFVAPQDAPVTVGLVIDGSGSMREIREDVVAAASAFVATSNPLDDVFALVFNDFVRAALPPERPFTGDALTMRAALLGSIAARGRTALYDALVAGLDYVGRGRYLRKVLIVVGDGGDNASTATFDDVVRRAQASDATVYAVALVDPLDRDVDPGRLIRLAEMTGGEGYRPRSVADVAGVLQGVARDIRHTYTLGYVPTNLADDGRVRRTQVSVNLPGGQGLSVRVRQQYSRQNGSASDR